VFSRFLLITKNINEGQVGDVVNVDGVVNSNTPGGLVIEIIYFQ
jgi:hypothetical protein